MRFRTLLSVILVVLFAGADEAGCWYLLPQRAAEPVPDVLALEAVAVRNYVLIDHNVSSRATDMPVLIPEQEAFVAVEHVPSAVPIVISERLGGSSMDYRDLLVVLKARFGILDAESASVNENSRTLIRQGVEEKSNKEKDVSDANAVSAEKHREQLREKYRTAIRSTPQEVLGVVEGGRSGLINVAEKAVTVNLSDKRDRVSISATETLQKKSVPDNGGQAAADGIARQPVRADETIGHETPALLLVIAFVLNVIRYCVHHKLESVLYLAILLSIGYFIRLKVKE